MFQDSIDQAYYQSKSEKTAFFSKEASERSAKLSEDDLRCLDDFLA